MRTFSLIATFYTLRRFLFCMVFLLTESALAKSAYLNVYPIISVSREDRVVNMKQLAKLTHKNTLTEADITRINSVNIELPLIGIEPRQYLSGDEIKRMVMSALNKRDSVSILVSAPPRILMRVKSNAGESNCVVDAANEKLQYYLDENYQKVKISVVARPALNYEASLTCVPRKIVGPAKKRMVVWVDVFDAVGLVESVSVWFKVKAHARVFVLKSSVNRGEVVSLAHFAIRSINISELSPKAVRVNEMKEENFSNFIYGADVSRGEVLDRRFMHDIVAINFGDNVRVISRAGGVSITTNAIAQEKADVGEQVRLMAVESKEFFWGKVVARKQVVIEANP